MAKFYALVASNHPCIWPQTPVLSFEVPKELQMGNILGLQHFPMPSMVFPMHISIGHFLGNNPV